MSTAAHLVMGRAAEAAAARYLGHCGYRVLQTNFRARGGELDVIAIEGEVLAVVEVRYRASERFGSGAASITADKRRRIVRATRALLATRRAFARLPVRFDVVEVAGEADALACRLIRGAFSL